PLVYGGTLDDEESGFEVGGACEGDEERAHAAGGQAASGRHRDGHIGTWDSASRQRTQPCSGEHDADHHEDERCRNARRRNSHGSYTTTSTARSGGTVPSRPHSSGASGTRRTRPARERSRT